MVHYMQCLPLTTMMLFVLHFFCCNHDCRYRMLGKRGQRTSPTDMFASFLESHKEENEKNRAFQEKQIALHEQEVKVQQQDQLNRAEELSLRRVQLQQEEKRLAMAEKQAAYQARKDDAIMALLLKQRLPQKPDSE